MYCGLASKEKTVDHCNISVDELDYKIVGVFRCKHCEERQRERERKTNGQRDRERDTETKTERDTEREKERKASKEIRNDAEVEHTYFLGADIKGYQECV